MTAVIQRLASSIKRAFRNGMSATRPVYRYEIHASTAGKRRLTERTGRPLVAFRVTPLPNMRLVVASTERNWMLATDQHFANRCLPLLIANQAGWLVLNSHKLRATWNGGDDIASIRIEYLSGVAPYPALSHFGYGILTWTLPYLFRTPPGYNLLVRGPSNWPKDGICALEGIVESDWTAATFTMNWKVTRPNLPIMFEVNEPICMIVPQRRGELEEFRPQISDIHSDREAERKYKQWRASRTRFLDDLRMPFSKAAEKKWQKDYFRGVAAGEISTVHETKLRLRDFDELE
jgi:hypothetical protein